MKSNILPLTLAVFAFALSAGSCKKDSSGDSGAPACSSKSSRLLSKRSVSSLKDSTTNYDEDGLLSRMRASGADSVVEIAPRFRRTTTSSTATAII